ncbi:M56 family metallopeptidase [Brevundimonas sp.]|uniref:M56 family metallopeptidase n=1 Tax=Brevundimonas sp. TaxID=1871086 RepID=UPI0035AEED3B
MTGPQLILLSLGLSIGLAAVSLVAFGRWERRLGDPDLRERLWGALLYVSVVPALLVPLSLLLPAPVVRVEELAGGSAPSVDALSATAAAGGFSFGAAALAVLASAAGLSLLRAVDLARRAIALRRLVSGARDADPGLVRRVSTMAARLGAPAPRVLCNAALPTALLTGFVRPILLLPETAGPSAEAISAHELAHLRRGDHRTVWIEEALLIVVAANPLLSRVRARRAAAREEACDALALAGASDSVRRRYARALVEAIRKAPNPTVPALTFTSAKRSFAMLRLKAILDPVAPAAVGLRRTASVAVVLAAVAAASASVAVAAQREAIVTSSGQSSDTAEADRTIRNPAWAQHPIPAYPAAALEAGANAGSASVRCIAQTDGALSDCAMLTETPPGLGFGAAAVEAAGNARLAARHLAEVREPTPVVFTVRFRISG